MKNKFYAGVGSRKTPEEFQILMEKIACRLNELGYVLRSGGALGADLAFQKGSLLSDIYIPYPSFNLQKRKEVEKEDSKTRYISIRENDKEAHDSVDKFHPEPSKLSDIGRSMMARNYRQIIGLNEPNSKFVICWTEDGEIRGGTGQAIRIANHFNIPVFNLAIQENRERLEKFIQ